MTPFRIKLLGKYYTIAAIRSRKYDGMCDPPDAKNKVILISERCFNSRVALLDVSIHELLHAADWSRDEQWVEQVASDMARAINRLLQEAGL